MTPIFRKGRSLFLLIFLIGALFFVSCEKRIPQNNKEVRIGSYQKETEEDSESILVLEEDNRFQFITDTAISACPKGNYKIKGDKLILNAMQGEFVFTIKNKSELSLERVPKEYQNLSKWSIYQFKNPEEQVVTENTESDSEQWDLPPMIMIDGQLYKDTGRISTEGRCGNYDGEILYEVGPAKKPYKDDQSNFGIGYGYQYTGEKGRVDVYINRKWCVFEEAEE